MQITAQDLVGLLTSVQAVVASDLTDDEKIIVLQDIQNGMPPMQFCINSAGTRAITSAKISEAIDGLQPKKAQSKKPVQKRAGKASAKGTKA